MPHEQQTGRRASPHYLLGANAVLACLSDDIEYYWDMGSRPIRSKETIAPPAQASTASADD